MDAYFNFRQLDTRAKDLPHMKDYFQVAHFKLQHLFCWRQRLFDTNKKNTVAFKPHGCCHIPEMIIEYGSTSNTDTVLYENMHIVNAKEAYTSSSRRSATAFIEMTKSVQSIRLASYLGFTFEEETNDAETANPSSAINNNIFYETKGDITFEGSKSSLFRAEISIGRDRKYYCSHKELKFIHPDLNLDDVLRAISSSKKKDVIAFHNNFMQGNKGIINSTSQPLTLFKYYYCTTSKS